MRFLTNVTGDWVDDPEDIRRFLAEQVCAPVRWEPSMRRALESGVDRFLEPGPGEVLAGLMRKIDRSVTVRSAASPDGIDPAGETESPPSF